MQLWLDACPEQENTLVQKKSHTHGGATASCLADGEQNSLQLRQQVWVHHITTLEKGNRLISSFTGRAPVAVDSRYVPRDDAQQRRTRGVNLRNGAFIHDEPNIALVADARRCALIACADLPV